MKLGHLCWPQVGARDRANTIVLIPTGSMEQYGPHLPLEVDAFIAGRLAKT
jgi:creatinine amidohydrolase